MSEEEIKKQSTADPQDSLSGQQPEEIISPEQTVVPETEEQPETLNLKPLNPDMEVHHHTHPDSHRDHEQKNWKSYFWEFLMLFLAVTLGFFVENKREHYIEDKRAGHLVTSLIKDLQKDTALLNWLDVFRLQKRKNRLDSFYTILNMPPEKIDKKIFYPLFYNICEWYPFISSTGTINQLKNAGYLRYFSDNQLLEFISDYEFLVQDFKNDETMEFHLHYDKLVQLVKQNTDNSDMYTFYINDSLPAGSGIKPFDPQTLNTLKAYTVEQMWYNKTQMIKQNNRVKSKAIDFINYLQSIH